MSHEPRIYFLRSNRSKAIKIGTTIDVRQRVMAIQAGIPMDRLSLVAEIPGDERYERVLHRHFAEYRIRGEWFRCEGRLAQFVELLPSLPAHVRPPSRRREEDVRKAMQPKTTPLIHHPAMKAYWQAQRELLWKLVQGYGVDRFAALVNTKRYVVYSAFRGTGRNHVPAKWLFQIRPVISDDDALRLGSHMMLLPPTSSNEEENRRRLEQHKKMIKEVSPQIFDFIEREWPLWGGEYARN